MTLILNGSAGAMVAAHAMTDHARHVGASAAVSGQDENTSKALTESSCHHIQGVAALARSEEHTSELQSLMRISYAVFCFKKKNEQTIYNTKHHKNTQLP